MFRPRCLETAQNKPTQTTKKKKIPPKSKQTPKSPPIHHQFTNSPSNPPITPTTNTISRIGNITQILYQRTIPERTAFSLGDTNDRSLATPIVEGPADIWIEADVENNLVLHFRAHLGPDPEEIGDGREGRWGSGAGLGCNEGNGSGVGGSVASRRRALSRGTGRVSPQGRGRGRGNATSAATVSYSTSPPLPSGYRRGLDGGYSLRLSKIKLSKL